MLEYTEHWAEICRYDCNIGSAIPFCETYGISLQLAPLHKGNGIYNLLILYIFINHKYQILSIL